MLCAAEENGDGGKDACQGDSGAGCRGGGHCVLTGGPLVTKTVGSDGVTPGQNYELIGASYFLPPASYFLPPSYLLLHSS